MVPLVFFAASCFVGGKKIYVRKRQEATLTSLPSLVRVWFESGLGLFGLRLSLIFNEKIQ